MKFFENTALTPEDELTAQNDNYLKNFKPFSSLDP